MAEDEQKPHLVGILMGSQSKIWGLPTEPEETQDISQGPPEDDRMMNNDAAKRTFHFLGPEQTDPNPPYP